DYYCGSYKSGNTWVF
nr:immunoglobulin light chain junction region [Macaca mulatta]